MLDFYNMSEKDIIFLSAAVAAVIADGLDSDELNTIGNFMQCIGQDLVSAAAQKDVYEKKERERIAEKKKN